MRQRWWIRSLYGNNRKTDIQLQHVVFCSRLAWGLLNRQTILSWSPLRISTIQKSTFFLVGGRGCTGSRENNTSFTEARDTVRRKFQLHFTRFRTVRIPSQRFLILCRECFFPCITQGSGSLGRAFNLCCSLRHQEWQLQSAGYMPPAEWYKCLPKRYP